MLERIIEHFVSTYWGSSKEYVEERKQDHDEPKALIVIQPYSDGVLLLLGPDDSGPKPTIHVERRPGGWSVMLQAEEGCDQQAELMFLDSGRMILNETRFCNPPLELVHSAVDVPELNEVYDGGRESLPSEDLRP